MTLHHINEPPYDPDYDTPNDTTPSQDMTAEQSVLGAMLLAPSAIADALEVLTGADFYRPAHEQIFDTITTLHTAGTPADPVTVAAELEKRSQLQKVGGAPYLHTLSANVPTVANATYYAHIVRDKARLRTIEHVATKLRWESLTRPAPPPTEPNPKTGRPRLSPRFEEWMMGLPDGWITDVPGVTWKEAVRMCGNGVVPQQAEAATRWLLSVMERTA